MVNEQAGIPQKYPWAFSLLLVTVVIVLFNLFFTPLLNSGDDAFMMYTLGGGYGETPTNLLQYNHIWHPWLGWLIKSLYQNAPGINWYSVALLLFHVLGLSSVLYVFLQRTKWIQALLFFAILFFFVEARLLLSLTFTGTAFVLGLGGVCLLSHQLQRGNWKSLNILAAIIFLLLTGMLRLQVCWLVMVLFGSVVLTWLNKKQLVQWGVVIVTIAGLLFVFNKIHVNYYQRNIPGWEQQEKFRQALFYSYNRQLKSETTFTDSTEAHLFFAGFLYDSVKFNTARIDSISKQITRNRSFINKEDVNGLYWFFIEMRVYLLLLVVLLAIPVMMKKYRLLADWSISLAPYLALHVYLFLYLKITEPLHLGLLLFLFLTLLLQLCKIENPMAVKGKSWLPWAILLLLSFGWIGVRIFKENETNKQKHQRFLCMINELNQQPGKLFVATDDSFPLGYASIWDRPQQYPAANLLYKDRLITHTYLQTLKRKGISNLDSALLYNKNVFLLGAALPALTVKYQPAVLTGPFTVFHCLEVRQLDVVR